ncbi:MAG: NAD(+) diphosphatase [Rhodobacteraceae bacterium]|nr:MAG: NAD(+) diphosphatase [Paracoccaceae bacterium]
MRNAFSGGWQDRDAQARGNAARQAQMLASARTRVLPMWRGKPQLASGALGYVAPPDPLLAQAETPFLYLGKQEGRAHFAADISRWEPEVLDRAALAMFTDTTHQVHPAATPGAYFGELRLAMTQLPASEAAMAATARAIFNWHRTHRFCARCGSPSEIAMAGWERHCPACGAKHFPRTDPVVIMLVNHGNALLLGRSHGWPEGMYSALAGFVEPGETIEIAVSREVLEETGLSTRSIRYIASQPWPFPNSLMLGCVAEATNRDITLDDELEDALWLSREEVLAAWSGQHPRITPARRGAIAHFLIGQWLAGHV